MAILKISAAALLMLSLNACVHGRGDCHDKKSHACEMHKDGKKCDKKDCSDKKMCKMKDRKSCEMKDKKKGEMSEMK